MHKKSGTSKDTADKVVNGIKRKTRKHSSAEEKIRVVLPGGTSCKCNPGTPPTATRMFPSRPSCLSR
ncbi:MAG TPA: hypothetical protein VJ942_15530 [Roseovarius sp.]|nr:hypothetical protein [Roseovarius sp.]